MDVMGDAFQGFVDGFAEMLQEQIDRRKELLADLDYDTARRHGRDGAAAAVAPLIWGELVGERWDTTTTAEFLGVSRQALHDRVRRGTLLGVPGRGTTWFPTWEFDLGQRRIRPVVAQILGVFEVALGDRPDPLVIASWVQSPQSALDGLSPLDWMSSPARDDQAVVTAARRSAAKLAA